MSNYMIIMLNNSLNQIYELFGNLITIDDVDTRNLLIVGIIVESKILIEIIDGTKLNQDLTSCEIKSTKIIKERLVDLIDRCLIILE